jgi:lipopolysaccharide transport system ATP-binding protein
MSSTVISMENLSKSYQLGSINTGTFYGDLNRRWAKLRGLPDPYLKIGEKDHGNRQGEILWALRDINFQVQQGEALGIIGRNGAGKSTLLKVLSRVTAPTSGEVKIKGRIASLLEVGTGFHPELTGRENIYLNGAIMGMDKAEISRKFDEIVDFSAIEKFIDTPVKRYSSGMYVRLAFAVAAHLEPEILIVDEVLAVGDAQFQKKCMGKMGEVASQGRTVLFVSHNMSSVAQLCNRGILLNSGQIVTVGSIGDVVDTYMRTVSEESVNEVVFHEHPDTVPYFTRFSMSNDRGEQTRLFSNSEGFSFEIEYVVTQNISDYHLYFLLERADGLLILKAADDDYGQIIDLGSEPGHYTTKIRFPGNILNAGIYQFRMAFGKRRGVYYDERTGFSFEIEDWNDYTKSSFGRRNGTLLMPVDWEQTKITSLGG